MLFGYNWPPLLTNLSYGGQPWPLQSNFYLGEVNITQPGYSMLPISFLQHILPESTYTTLVQNFEECFHLQDRIYTYVPSMVSLVAADVDYKQVMATSSITTYLQHLPSMYRDLKAGYIFNVCAGQKYRGQGYTKSILISQINKFIRSGITAFLLEVDPTNISAYKLYQSLGFYKIDSIENDKYDLYYLPTSSAIKIPPK
jgi:hypothetical protein